MRSLDHVMSIVPDLEKAVALVRALGFTVTQKGVHLGRGTANYLVMLPGCYWELLAVEMVLPVNEWATPALNYPGLFGCAIRSDDVNLDSKNLRMLEISVGAQFRAERPVEIDGKKRLASFDVAQIKPIDGFDAYLFLCRHLTPDLIWNSEWQKHPNGCRCVIGLDIVAKDARQMTDFLANLLHVESQGSGPEMSLSVDGLEIRIIAQSIYFDRYPKVDIRYPDGAVGAFAGLRFSVPSVRAVLLHAGREGLHSQRYQNEVYFSESALGATRISFEERAPITET